METSARHALIGVFALAMIATTFVLVWWFGGAGGISQGRDFRVEFKGSAGGLNRGAIVTFNGLNVGEVLSVGLVANDPRAVAALIKVGNSVPMRVDTKARLESLGLGGASMIALTGGAPDALELKGSDSGPPTLTGEPSQLTDLLGNVSSLSATAEALAEKANALLSDNSGSIGDVVKNLDLFSKALSENAPVLKSSAASLDDFAAASRSVRRLADDLDMRTKEISVGLLRFSNTGLREWEALAIDGRQTVGDLDRVLRGIEKNPSSLIFGAK